MTVAVILICVVLVALEIVLLSYMKLDKRRFHARRLWPLLGDSICEWMDCAADLSKTQSEPCVCARLAETVEFYRQSTDPFKKTAAVNEASRLCLAISNTSASEYPPISILRKRQDELQNDMYTAIGYYNEGVQALNKTLSNPVASVIGRLFKFETAEILFPQIQ